MLNYLYLILIIDLENNVISIYVNYLIYETNIYRYCDSKIIYSYPTLFMIGQIRNNFFFCATARNPVKSSDNDHWVSKSDRNIMLSNRIRRWCVTFYPCNSVLFACLVNIWHAYAFISMIKGTDIKRDFILSTCLSQEF